MNGRADDHLQEAPMSQRTYRRVRFVHRCITAAASLSISIVAGELTRRPERRNSCTFNVAGPVDQFQISCDHTVALTDGVRHQMSMFLKGQQPEQ